jgi:recombination protein RecT
MTEENLPLATVPAAREYMLSAFRQFQSIIGDAQTTKRYMAIFLNCVEKAPKLLQCSRSSLRNALVESARLDLEPNSVQQLCFLIPYGRDCQLQIGYRGLCQLVMRDGGVKSIYARAVYEGDKFEVHYGSKNALTHEPLDPWATPDLEKLTGCYAMATLASGLADHEVIGIEELQKIAAMSKSPARKDWPIEMHKKAPLKRLCKRLPLKSPQWQRALELEERDGAPPEPEAPLIVPENAAQTSLEPEGTTWVKVAKPAPEPEPEETRRDLNDRIRKTWAYLEDLGARPAIKQPMRHYTSTDCDDETAHAFADFLAREMLKAEAGKVKS